ncbi:MAG: GH116 family glycosyl hydrolase [Planctomycetota bacterium]|jgi:uncharacterized protein (DUF608 family)
MSPPDSGRTPYSREELLAPAGPRVYRDGELDNIAFPLGGIGTGSIALGGWGQLRDFEIHNRPNKGFAPRYTFFTLYAQAEGEEGITRLLQGPTGGGDWCVDGNGVDRYSGAGLPRFRDCEFEGAFPFARVRLGDPDVPLEVEIEAWNPFIPLNPDDSSLPAALFGFTLMNTTDAEVEVVLFANLENVAGSAEADGGRVEVFEDTGARGLLFSSSSEPDSPRHGTLALSTTHDDVLVRTRWLRGKWFDALHDFWDNALEGRLAEETAPAEREKGRDVGGIALRVGVPAGGSVTLPVAISWHTPNFEKYWDRSDDKPVWKNHYATLHRNAAAVATYLAENGERLERETRLFADALHGSTLPAAVLDAVSSQISILKTTTCLRLTDGTFYGWEGCRPSSGCCEGTCTHVWNYAQALAHLFPSLERSIRESDYANNQAGDGHMAFRMPLPLGQRTCDCQETRFHPAADGQLGGIMKVYREWQLCGDDDWLRGLWPDVKKSLEFARSFWDRDGDGVLEGSQHNTYDIEFFGPNTMCTTFYLGALRAAEEIARYLGEEERAAEYRALYEKGRALCDEKLFNGEFYRQIVHLEDGKPLSADDAKFPKYQYGEGCLSDQLIGDWFARMLGLGNVLDSGNVKSALAAMFRHNWKSDLSTHENPQRVYALGEEAGLLLCSWPRGGRPRFPFVYSDEVWCGIEYQVAAHMIQEGLLEEGLSIVRGVRDRHDGTRRNPWNEFECGNHYARSMASYALLGALSGLNYSAPEKRLCFAPRVSAEDFSCFFAVGSAWGVLRRKGRTAGVAVLGGKLELSEFGAGFETTGAKATLGGNAVEASPEDRAVRFGELLHIAAGQSLELST